jgi:hypothetical protein
MRILFFCLLQAIACALAAQSDDRNILNRDTFPAFVKKVTLNGYGVSEPSKDRVPVSSRYFELDSTGAWMVRIETFSDGDVSSDTMTYDAKLRKRVVTRSNDFEPDVTTTTYNKDNTVRSIHSVPRQRDPQLTEFEYDAAKRITKMTVTHTEIRLIRYYSYDQSDRLVSMKLFSGTVAGKNEQLDYEESYTYDGDNYVMYGSYYGANESVRTRDTVTCRFNERHLIIARNEVLDNGQMIRQTIYEYDDKGRVVQQSEESTALRTKEFRTSSVRMEYDSMGFYSLYVEEATSYGFSNRWTTKYNERGLPVETRYSTEAETFYYEWIYEYR